MKPNNTIIWNNNNINGNININNNFNNNINPIKRSGSITFKNSYNKNITSPIITPNSNHFRQIKIGGNGNKSKPKTKNYSNNHFGIKTEGNELEMNHAKNYINYLHENLDTSYNANNELNNKTEMIINMAKDIENEMKRNNEIYKLLILSYNDKLKANNKYKNEFINFLNQYKKQHKIYLNELNYYKKDYNELIQQNNDIKNEIKATEEIISYLKTTEEILQSNSLNKLKKEYLKTLEKGKEGINHVDIQLNKLSNFEGVGVKDKQDLSKKNSYLKEKLSKLEEQIRIKNESKKKIKKVKSNNDIYKQLINSEKNKSKDLINKIYALLKEKEKRKVKVKAKEKEVKRKEIKVVEKVKKEKKVVKKRQKINRRKSESEEESEDNDENEREIEAEKEVRKKKKIKKKLPKREEASNEKEEKEEEKSSNSKEKTKIKAKYKKKKKQKNESQKNLIDNLKKEKEKEKESEFSALSEQSKSKLPPNSLSMDELSSIMSAGKTQKKLSQSQETIIDILTAPLKGSYLYTITNKGKLLSFNISLKKFAIIDSNIIDGWTSFIPNYLKDIEGSLLLNTLEGLFVITGPNHNDLYFYSQEKNLIAKITSFRECHKYGGLLLSPSPDNKLYAIGGDNKNNEVENFSFDNDVCKSLPNLLTRRINASYSFINCKLYAIFGEDNNSIEYVNIKRLKKGWTKIDYKMNSENPKYKNYINNIFGHVSLPVNDNDILIVGGKNNKKMMVFDLEEKTIDVTEMAVPFIDVVGEYIFDKEKYFNQTTNEEKNDKDGKSLKQLIGMDSVGNVHLFDYSFNYVVLLIKNHTKENK